MTDLTEEQIAEIVKEFQKELEILAYSSLSINLLHEKFMQKEFTFEPEIEYKQDYAFYQGRYWFSVPYPRDHWIGFVNIIS